MNIAEVPVDSALLALLDETRVLSREVVPGNVVREWSADGSEVRIVYSACSHSDLAAVIQRELRLAREVGADFEWKVYGHDKPSGLPATLCAAGLKPGPREMVLALNLCDAPTTIRKRVEDAHEVRTVNVADLVDYERISLESGRKDAADERERLAVSLVAEPESIQVHVAYRDGVPVSGGRLYLAANGTAELAGGRTIPRCRRQGFFTATVLSRMSAAIAAGAQTLWVDALPSSAPIFIALGFSAVTWTEPYVWSRS
ncbi:GNAT family N-acetyltransferase [Devriesea agamarum]|uniref:GNAT family N-acetyltransferase n=1 Tax=Devriesea agamarum TaxID=472569 RepID=UPI00071E1102|nr:hypothetical protein [Devriesea agamarum]